MKILSILVPMYNMEKYIQKCLESICVPAYEDLYEVIIIDDGSKDKSYDMCLEFVNTYPAIYKLIKKENGGYGSVFNEGIRLATGKYVKLLDADDFFDTSVFSDYLEELKCRDDDLVFNYVYNYTDSSIVAKNNQYLSFAETTQNIYDVDMTKNSIFIHNFCMKKEILLDTYCPTHCLYTDAIILTHALSNSTTIYFSKFFLYCYRTDRDEQSTAIHQIIKKTKDITIVTEELRKYLMQIFVERKPCSLIIEVLSITHNQLMISYELQKGLISNYVICRKICKELKKTLRKINIRTNSINYKQIRYLVDCSIMFFPIAVMNRRRMLK